VSRYYYFISEKIHDFLAIFWRGIFAASGDRLDFFYNFSTIFWVLSRAGIDQPADMPSARSFGDLLIGRHQPSENTHCF
jgi:hypothetical protein